VGLTRVGLELEVNHLTIRKGGTTLVDDVTFSVAPGEFVVIAGPNGAGKTTLLRAIAGERPYSGSVCIGRESENLYDDPEKWFREIGQIPVDNVLHESLPVFKALEYVGRLRGIDPDTLKDCIEDWLEKFGISDKSHSLIGQLSSGERKKVNICAELLTDPGLLLLDEPTTNLDPHAERELMSRLADRAKEGTTIIAVSHTIRSLDQCNRVIFMGTSKIRGFIVREPLNWKWIDPSTRQVRETVTAADFSGWLIDKFEKYQTEERLPGSPTSKRSRTRHRVATKDARTAWQHYRIILYRQMRLLLYEGPRIPVRETWQRVEVF